MNQHPELDANDIVSTPLPPSSSPSRLPSLQEVLNRYRLRRGGNKGKQQQQRSHLPQGGGRKSPVPGNPSQSSGDQGDGGNTSGGTGGLPPPPLAGPVSSGGGLAGGGLGGEGKGEEGSGGGSGCGKLFPIRNMNVMNPLDSGDNQIDDTVNRRRAARMHSLLQVRSWQSVIIP